MTKLLCSALGVPLLLLCLSFGARPNVASGETIDATNYQMVEGLLPDSVTAWIKKGDLTLDLGTLEFDPGKFMTSAMSRSLEMNRGRYELDQKNRIVDRETGKPPKFIEGIPMTVLDFEDPKVAAKIMYNRSYYSHSTGNQRIPITTIWVARSGPEREVHFEYRRYPMDGYPEARREPNPEGVERYSMIAVMAPEDIAGTNILNWRYRDERPDSMFGYIPAIRRVRRMSPANRSDSFLGSDVTYDDPWGFDGKIQEFEWRLIRRQLALVPMLTAAPQPIEVNGQGEWVTSKAMRRIVYGWQKGGWKGAPWMPANLIWVKRPVCIIEAVPKDPYYNYGPVQIWIDQEQNIMLYYKTINNRKGQYWKTLWMSYAGLQSNDGGMRLLMMTSMIAVDDRTDHATIMDLCNPTNPFWCFSRQDRDDYSLLGLQRISK